MEVTAAVGSPALLVWSLFSTDSRQPAIDDHQPITIAMFLVTILPRMCERLHLKLILIILTLQSGVTHAHIYVLSLPSYDLFANLNLRHNEPAPPFSVKLFQFPHFA